MISTKHTHTSIGGLLAAFLVFVGVAQAERVYQEPRDFVQDVFDNSPPKPSILRIFGERRKIASDILGHAPHMLRTRYWLKGDTSAWILEEIGKVKPITAGFIVKNGQIADVRILIYRESHGAEVRFKYFTSQFDGARLSNRTRLTNTVDGISGATLSVSAVKRLAALALFFDEQARRQ